MQQTNRTPQTGQVLGESQSNSWLLFLLLAIGAVIVGYYLFAGDQQWPVVVTDDGERTLAPDRLAKLDRELEEIDNAVQYALVATAKGFYPCYSCPIGMTLIQLNEGEVWKYGTTRKGENGRYPNQNFGATNVIFVPQFWGNYAECLKMEKINIYSYPLLPEAQKRSIILVRPPGNANDN